MHHSEQVSQEAPQGASIAAMTIGLLLAGFILFAAAEAFSMAPCWAALALPVIIALPIWLASRESVLFSRRALLQGATRDDSRVRSMLWQGHLTSAVLLVVAIALSLLLLATATLLSATQWAVLFASALLLDQ